MKNLIFLRHAKSDWLAKESNSIFNGDFERPLAARGRQACKQISAFFFSIQLKVDLIEYSAATRATQTFNLVKQSVSYSISYANAELYTFNWKKMLQIISRNSDEINSLLVIGHNPAIEDLICYLTPSNVDLDYLRTLRSKYPTGGIAFLKLDIGYWHDLKENCGELTKFVRPKDIVSN